MSNFLMQKVNTAVGQFTWQINVDRWERHAKAILTDMYCTLIVRGDRRIGIIQPDHFKYVGQPVVGDMPDFEVDIKGCSSGKTLRTTLSSRKVTLHKSAEDAMKECKEFNQQKKQ